MNKVLERIMELRKERGWTEYYLATRADLPQSTISTWYKRDTMPTISSIERICDAFGISLSQFFLDDPEKTVTFSERPLRLINYAAKLEPEQFDRLLEFLDTL